MRKSAMIGRQSNDHQGGNHESPMHPSKQRFVRNMLCIQTADSRSYPGNRSDAEASQINSMGKSAYCGARERTSRYSRCPGAVKIWRPIEANNGRFTNGNG